MLLLVKRPDRIRIIKIPVVIQSEAQRICQFTADLGAGLQQITAVRFGTEAVPGEQYAAHLPKIVEVQFVGPSDAHAAGQVVAVGKLEFDANRAVKTSVLVLKKLILALQSEIPVVKILVAVAIDGCYAAEAKSIVEGVLVMNAGGKRLGIFVVGKAVFDRLRVCRHVRAVNSSSVLSKSGASECDQEGEREGFS